MSLQITGIILAKNEENSIIRCIKSIAFCDEILIIDDNSTDKTTTAINKLENNKIKIIQHALDNNFSQARNFGVLNAQNDWILFVDSDEIVSEALAFEISNVISMAYNGFYIKRFDHIWGKVLTHGEAGIKLIRLAKKGAGEWVNKVHEDWKIKGKVGVLKNPLVHYPHHNVAEFLSEINYYTTIRAQELFKKNIKVYWWSIIAYPVCKFIINYFLKRGFLDGIPGLIFAVIMSFHSFLVRGKLWLLSRS